MGYGCKTQAEVDSLKSLGLDWFYTWGPTANVATGQAGLGEFVPMLWSDNPTRTAALPGQLAALSPQASRILAYNEPDSSGQADMTPLDALWDWKNLAATGLKIGSPAAVSTRTAWMDQFMGAAKALGIKLDFVACHIYQQPSVNTFLGKVDELHDKFGLPVWVTETAVHDFNADADTPNAYSRDQVNDYMRALWVEVQKRPWLERFAWKTRSTSDLVGGSSALFNSNGTLTSTGVTYRNL